MVKAIVTTIRRRNVVMRDSPSKPKLSVDDLEVDVARDQDSGVYSAEELPYQTFDSLEDVAKTFVKNVKKRKK